MNNPKAQDIKTHGIELVLIGVVGFMVIIAFTIFSYHFFVKDRVRESEEYKTAVHYVKTSSSLKEQLVAPLVSFDFTDIRVSESNDFGHCFVYFDLVLENQLKESMRVGLIRIGDFWIVAEAELNPDTKLSYKLETPYKRILVFLTSLSYNNDFYVGLYLGHLQRELLDSRLLLLLEAKVKAYVGDLQKAQELLIRLQDRVGYSELAVLFERAMMHYAAGEFPSTINLLHDVIRKYDEDKAKSLRNAYKKSIFSRMPSDPFTSLLDHDVILAEAYRNLAVVYYDAKNFEKGVAAASMARMIALQIKSDTIASSALFMLGVHLHFLDRLHDADSVFKQVIEDVKNSNLSQKAWAYYYRAEHAKRWRREEFVMDYYERAVNLDPFNPVIRRDAIMYLMARNYAGDLEIALSLSLRGIQYGVSDPLFRTLSSQIYSRLGIRDKSQLVE
ncbi:MAG: tetratricopeptide repeat protein [Deltaproteobacteria bacterium]|nr:tetratricopeptide repeat protein [Deltaproteobacteria bacterium]